MKYYIPMEAHFAKRGLMIKPEKTELFCVKGNIDDIILGGYNVTPTTSLRFLGFHVNEGMAPKAHIQSRVYKIQGRTQKILEFRAYLHKNQLIVIYMTWIQSQIHSNDTVFLPAITRK